MRRASHGIEFEAYQQLDAAAAKELHMQERLYEAKQRRIQNNQPGKRHGSPFGELERIYKAALELSGAKLRVRREIAESSAHKGQSNNAEANWLAQQCRVLRLENAKLRRVMRANHVRVPWDHVSRNAPGSTEAPCIVSPYPQTGPPESPWA